MKAEAGSVVQPVGTKVFVQQEDRWGPQAGGIFIPDVVRQKKTWVGRVVKSSPASDEAAGFPLTGKRVVLRGYSGRPLYPDQPNSPWVCDVDRIEAVIEDEELAVKGGGDAKGLERCPKCGPANSKLGPGNVILEADPTRPPGSQRLSCPRCGYRSS